MKNIIHIVKNNLELGFIIRASFHSNDIEFLSNDCDALQLGYMNRPDNYVVVPHVHNSVRRDIYFTEEILFIQSGVVRIDFYDCNRVYVESLIAYGGDIVVLKAGGHGIKFLERAEIFEVKQGPYLGINDKIRFEPIDDDRIILKNYE